MSIRIALVAVVAACHAPPSATARFHDVTGGPRWASVHGIDSRGTVSVGGLTGAFTSFEDVATGRHRSKLELGPVVIGDGYDGTAGWELTTGGEVVAADTPEARTLAVTDAWLVRRGYFSPTGARYRELGAKTEADHHYRVVEATPDGGAPIELWFDDATGLLARTRNQDGINTVVTTFDDYRDVGGLRLPFASVTDSGDPRNRVTTRITRSISATSPTPSYRARAPMTASRSPPTRPRSRSSSSTTTSMCTRVSTESRSA